MSRPGRSHLFGFLIVVLLALLALGVYLLYLGLSTPPFVQAGAWAL